MGEFDFVKEVDDIFPGKSEGIRKNKLEPNRLAFLAVTSKCEFIIRDEIAFRLQEKYANKIDFIPKDYLIAREWTEKRYDLAVLRPKGEIPVCIVEFKAVSTAKTMGKHMESVVEDVKKLGKKYHTAKKYVALIVMLPNKPFNSEYEPGIKYYSKINKQFPKHPPRDNDCFGKWKAMFGKEKCTQIKIDAGNYGGVNIRLDLFIAGPLKFGPD
jgi:hypothetical protein